MERGALFCSWMTDPESSQLMVLVIELQVRNQPSLMVDLIIMVLILIIVIRAIILKISAQNVNVDDDQDSKKAQH